MWVHIIEDTPEGEAYKKSVERFNEKYDGTYFADIEFIPRNDSGGGYSDKINASVMSGDLPDVITVDGPNISAYAAYDQITAFEEDENYKALYEQLRDYGHPRPKTPVYPQVSTSFQQVLEDVGLSGKDVQTEMDQSIERINAKLERYTR